MTTNATGIKTEDVSECDHANDRWARRLSSWAPIRYRLSITTKVEQYAIPPLVKVGCQIHSMCCTGSLNGDRSA
jgi:hypothetical protein